MLKGLFDIAANFILHGWAADDVTKEVLKLEIYVNEKFTGEVMAQNDFPHLKQLTRIYGPCGFAVKIPESVLVSGVNVIKVVSKSHQDYLRYTKSPGMNHLPVYLADEQFTEIKKYQGIFTNLNKLIETNPRYLADFFPYARNNLSLAPKEIDVLFINGLPDAMSSHYRVDAIAEMLSMNGYSVFSVTEELLEQAKQHFAVIGTIVYFRTPMTANSVSFYNKFAEFGSRVVYDIDDLVFREDLVSFIDGYRRLSKDEQKQYLEGVRSYRAMLCTIRRATTTTRTLVDNIKSLTNEVFLIPNLLTRNALAVCTEVFEKKRTYDPTRDFVIGYYSGTATHQSDFYTVARPLSRILVEHQNVRLRIVGKLDVNEFSELMPYAARIDRIDVMPYLAMVKDFSNVDLVIAPLELNNEFNDAKSELKFFEAAAAGVPVIASRTRTFEYASEDGKYCTLCAGEDDWLRALRRVIRDPVNARKSAARARNYVIENYTTTVSEKFNLDQIYRRAVDVGKYSGSRVVATPSSQILFLIPGVFPGSGGLRKIFTLVRYLVKEKGLGVDVLAVDRSNSSDLMYAIEGGYFETGATYLDSATDYARYGAVICTHWSTAHHALTHGIEKSKVIYFIQDYEPFFEPAGTSFLLAQQTYLQGYKHVYFGPWVGKYIKSNLKADGVDISFPIDRECYFPLAGRKTLTEKVRILIYAKPSQARRAFDLIVDAFQKLRGLEHQMVVATYGDHIPESALPVKFSNLGPINSPEKLGALYREFDLGISFSSTNPSLVGYEMLACGLPIVDLDIPLSEENYSRLKSALLVRPDPVAISEAIAKFVEDPAYRKSLTLDAARHGSELCVTEDEFASAFARVVSSYVSNAGGNAIDGGLRGQQKRTRESFVAKQAGIHASRDIGDEVRISRGKSPLDGSRVDFGRVLSGQPVQVNPARRTAMSASERVGSAVVPIDAVKAKTLMPRGDKKETKAISVAKPATKGRGVTKRRLSRD